MKIVLNKLFLLITFLFGIMEIFAKNDKNKGNAPPTPSLTGKPPSPPGLPIDDHIFWLIIISIILGFYVIYKYNQNTKPMV
ncbi:hypothetical protein [Flavobacterium ovatum]|uniref:hypothetical protein n=1 Tax=Flavobacterium ovatum TaxID=1928857 RepID=UPI00344C5441